MTDAEKVIALARTQIGTAESPPGSNNVIYNTDYYGGPVSGDGYPWCCVFIWWLFRKLGLSAEFCGGARTAYCPYVVSFAQNAGRWITDAHYLPGDLLLFDWDGDGVADHIGLCVEWYGTFGISIEGNSGNAVQQLSRSHSDVLGVYRPAYAGEETAGDAPEEYTVQTGDSLWSIAERLLGDGSRWSEIYEANNLPSTVIHPGQVLRLPVSNLDHQTPGGSAIPDAVAVELPVLRRESSGRVVETLQLLLQRWHFALPISGVDGEFGTETEAALAAFQREWGLEETGCTNAPTWTALIG